MLHNTNDCKVFYWEVQSAIEQRRIKFEKLTKPMKIDGHSFHANNMVEVEGPQAKGKSKVLTSDRAKWLGAIDPKCKYWLMNCRTKSDTKNDNVPGGLPGQSHLKCC